MPAQYFIDVENRMVLTTFSGVLTVSDVAEHAARLGHDPAFDSSFSELVDLTRTSEVQIDYLGFQTLAGFDPFSEKSKRAFVTPVGTHIYGSTRMFQILRGSGARIEIFSSREDASAWLKEG